MAPKLTTYLCRHCGAVNLLFWPAHCHGCGKHLVFPPIPPVA